MFLLALWYTLIVYKEPLQRYGFSLLSESLPLSVREATFAQFTFLAMIYAVGGATWVSFHHGGGVGIGYSHHAGQVIVADGTPAAAKRLERVLTTDPGLGVIRHADAGYEQAIAAAKRHGIQMPMLK